MSDLVAIAYPDQATAERVRGRLGEAIKAKLIEVDDAVVVTREADGKVKLHQGVSLTGTGAAGGALWGGVIGLLFLAPLLGMAVGAASGAAMGKVSDVGVDDQFLKTLAAKLPPGGAALIALGSTGGTGKVLERVGHYGGEVIQTSLSTEDEERLRAAMAEPAASA